MTSPAPGQPWRVAFVGPPRSYGACVQRAATRLLDPVFVDFREGGDVEAMLTSVVAHRPHAVVVFAPGSVPAGALDGLDALTLGWGEATGFDRVIGRWRSPPLPVADELYVTPRPLHHPPRVGFVGESTEHREQWLIDVKHRFDVLHVASETFGELLLETYRRIDIAITLHHDDGPAYEPAVARHLAAGHVVVSEPLSPAHGLEPGIDFLEAARPKQLEAIVARLVRGATAERAVRLRGRAKAEQFRASRVWPRLIADLAADVATFGSDRRSSATVRR